MARTALTKSSATGHYGFSAGAALTMGAADATDFNNFQAGGNDLIILHNTGASTRAVSLYGAADPYGRTATVTFNITAGSYMTLGPLPVLGWQQTDGKINIDAAHAEVKIGVVALP